MDFSVAHYLSSPDLDDPLLDISYLTDIDTSTFRKLFSFEPFGLIEQQNLESYKRHYKYIYSGCSESVGEFLSECIDTHSIDFAETRPYTWGNIVGLNLGISDTLNLAVGGASAMGIVNSLIRQIRSYGAPEHLLVLLPNLDARITFVQDPNNLISHRNPREIILDIGGIGDYENNYSKKPHVAQEVLTRRWITYLNIQSIISLETICAALGVNLIYSTWSTSTHRVLTAANAIANKYGDSIPFKNYIVSDYRKSGGARGCVIAAEKLKKDCHRNSDNHPLWDIGRGGDHMGAHAHIHAAEIFMDELTKRGFLPNL